MVVDNETIYSMLSLKLNESFVQSKKISNFARK